MLGYQRWGSAVSIDRLQNENQRRKSCLTVCLQVCCVLHFLARYNPRYVTEKSSIDAKSNAWIRFASNLVLLRNLQQLCGKLCSSVPRDVCHQMITFFESAIETNSA